MKVDELRVLEEDELGTRLKTARRELYELRFKHAVGQLENSSQIAKVRHDIARTMTVLNERELGISSIQEAEPALVGAPAKPAAAADSGFCGATVPSPAKRSGCLRTTSASSSLNDRASRSASAPRYG